ncbi:MAG: DCC1-like thiol-disulfide oxidoreductase family protein [Nitrospinae bacterium]|jgi:lipase maturation factor 1|nr:DCC1-like thiol-disulfide oxidoreductase family protein [Nitrospinota bacterium]MDA1109961.1 DCC1-like thiol-disulfide oxidoreductase family protein [Nitrospinota bacterium]
MKSKNRPVLIYDGDCDLCRRWMGRYNHLSGDRVDTISSQEAAHLFPEISPQQFQSSVQLVQPDGAVYEGAEAVCLALAFNSTHRWPLWLYRNIFGVASATEFTYRFIARHREFFSRFTRWRG